MTDDSPRHHLRNVDTETLTATCTIDGEVSIRKRWYGNGRIDWQCAVKRRAERQMQTERRRAQGKERRVSAHRHQRRDQLEHGQCDRCGFRPEHPSQLEVDHKVRRADGGGNDDANLWVICANCHRFKTTLESQPGWDLAAFIAMSPNRVLVSG